MPRPASSPGRERVRAAATELLRREELRDFSLENVAKKAGVTRMTVYNQFGSRAGLLEDVFDDLIERGAFAEIPTVFAHPDPDRVLDDFVAILGRFYADNRRILSRLTAAAGLDADLDAAMEHRMQRRRAAIKHVLERVGTGHSAFKADELLHMVDVMLNFGVFSSLAGADRSPEHAVPLVRALLRNLLGLKPAARSTRRKPRPHR